MTETTPPSPVPPFVRRSDSDGIATLLLDRGDRLNPLSSAMLAALREEVAKVDADPGVRVVVLAGAGRHFCAGHDLAELAASPTRAFRQALFDSCQELMLALVRLAPFPASRAASSARPRASQWRGTCRASTRWSCS